MQFDNGKINGKNVLITGGLGFIGSNLAHKLVREGAQVTIYDACLRPYGWNEANIKEIRSDINLIKADIRDAAKLSHVVIGKEYIFHLAAQVGREISMSDPYLDTEINCTGTLNLCRACADKNRETKIIFAGSRGQIGEPRYLPVDEAHPLNPTDVYGINKVAAEKYLFLYGKIYGFPVVSLRLNNVYGPRCQMSHGFYGVLNWFIRQAMENKPITVYGSGEQTRDYVYIDDVVQAFTAAAICSTTDYESYNIGSEKETVFLDMVKTVIKAVGQGEYIHIPFPPERESIDIKKFVVTCQKFRQAANWSPAVDLTCGTEETVDFYRRRYAEYISN